MSTCDILLLFATITVLVSHIGIAWAGILITPGNILDWVKPMISRLKSDRLQELLLCAKCVSGQTALWLVMALTIVHPYGLAWYVWLAAGLLWIPTVIVVTDQLNGRYGYG